MRALVVVFAFLGQMGFADCPNGTDLKTGIRVVYEPETEFEVFQSLNPHLVQSDLTSEDGSVWRAILVHGTYMISNEELRNGAPVVGARETYTYPVKPDQMPVPKPGTSWDVTISESTSNGLSKRRLDYRYEDMQQTTIGGSTYDMIEVSVPFEPGMRSVLNYFPELGFAIVAGNIQGGTRTDWPVHSIERVAQ